MRRGDRSVRRSNQRHEGLVVPERLEIRVVVESDSVGQALRERVAQQVDRALTITEQRGNADPRMSREHAGVAASNPLQLGRNALSGRR
jgi:hypothetical protein